MFREKRSFQIVFFGLVVKCFMVFICCSSSPNPNDEVEKGSYLTAGKSSLKRLGLHIQYRTCLPKLQNKDENAMARLSRKKNPQLNVLKKDFHFPPGNVDLFFFSFCRFFCDNFEFHYLFTLL